MKWIICLVLTVLPAFVVAQSLTVLPEDVSLRVEVEETIDMPVEREMIIIRILGTYNRHITLESLQQPDLQGFNWSQLGPDRWWEERIEGRLMKRFERKMALYPDTPGKLTIGTFTHNLTLTDEGDDWFDYQVLSDPVSIEVAPAPAGEDWWFPVRRLRISDKWSNTPDQLVPGEGVLRIVQIEALGVTPEMIPPMPELTSPSAMIFAHPEKRLVELSPQGPVTRAFWRWTIRPTNDTSAIVEPISFTYFDTTERAHREVVISAQRIAYNAGPTPQARSEVVVIPPSGRLPGLGVMALGLIVLAGGVLWGVWGRQFDALRAMQRFAIFDPLRRQLRRAVRAGDARAARRAAAAILKRDGTERVSVGSLRQLDRQIFAPGAAQFDLHAFLRDLDGQRQRADTNG